MTSPLEEPVYEVVAPEAYRLPVEEFAPPATNDISTVGFVWDYTGRGDDIFAKLRHDLSEVPGGLNFIGHEEFGNIHGPDEPAVVAALPGRLRELGCNAAVIAAGT